MFTHAIEALFLRGKIFEEWPLIPPCCPNTVPCSTSFLATSSGEATGSAACPEVKSIAGARGKREQPARHQSMCECVRRGELRLRKRNRGQTEKSEWVSAEKHRATNAFTVWASRNAPSERYAPIATRLLVTNCFSMQCPFHAVMFRILVMRASIHKRRSGSSREVNSPPIPR